MSAAHLEFARGLDFAKGHGTGNDFVLLPDPSGALELTPALVSRLCDRRTGIGGDGVLRVVRTAAAAEVAHLAGSAEWFMDYYNGDGSLAQMCGNGARVFARYLLDSGLADGPSLPLLTRAGVVVATVAAGEVSVTMPPVSVGGQGVVRVGGVEYKGTAASCGNPNLVCPVNDVSALDLSGFPELDAEQFPERANVEFVAPVAPGHVRMRVIERGVGETLSCGSGACAVAGVVLNGGSGTVTVDVPGGRLTVTIADGTCLLAGPAVIVATGTVAI